MDKIVKHCPIEGFTECYFALQEVWTRGDFRDYYRLEGEDFIALYRRKVSAIYLATVDGGAIEDPNEMTNERLDGIDYILWRWFGAAFREGVLEAQRLGEEIAQQSLLSTEEKADSAPS